MEGDCWEQKHRWCCFLGMVIILMILILLLRRKRDWGRRWGCLLSRFFSLDFSVFVCILNDVTNANLASKTNYD